MSENKSMQAKFSDQSGIKEYPAWKLNGFVALLVVLLLLIGAVLLFKIGLSSVMPLGIIAAIILSLVSLILLCGLTVVQPNTCAVVTFFGKYTGVIRQNGIWMVVPFSSTKKVSLRVRNFNSEKLKVNDTNGNPIEIAAVIVFRVVDA
ncbi:MAG: SPFH domain-containing protein, partial [Clostridiales bacterium]